MEHHFQKLFNLYSESLPNIWNWVDSIRTSHKDEYEDFIFIPSGFLAGYFLENIQKNAPELKPKPEAIEHLLLLAPIAAWRTTQGIYQFDEDILEETWNTSIQGNIPVEILFKLPEWCIYIPTPGKLHNGRELLGFFAYMDIFCIPDEEIVKPQLLLIFNYMNHFERASIVLEMNDTLENSIRNQYELQHLLREKANSHDELGIDIYSRNRLSEVEPFISLCLYVASQASEINHPTLSRRPAYPSPTKTKKGERYFPPNKPTQWEVGYRLGAALRQAQAEQEKAAYNVTGPKASARPHIRRAHWHTYWTGSKNDTQIPILKWLPPIPVNLELGEVIPTIRPVQESVLKC